MTGGLKRRKPRCSTSCAPRVMPLAFSISAGITGQGDGARLWSKGGGGGAKEEMV